MTAEADMYGHETTTERPAPGSASPPALPSTHRCGGVLVHGSALDCGTCASPPARGPELTPLDDAETTEAMLRAALASAESRAEQAEMERDAAAETLRLTRDGSDLLVGAEEARQDMEARLRIACAGSQPSADHDYADEVIGLLRVARAQRDAAEARAEATERRIRETEQACDMPLHMIATTLDAHRKTAGEDHERAEAAERARDEAIERAESWKETALRERNKLITEVNAEHARAETAEAALSALREGVRGLAEEWEREAERRVRDSHTTRNTPSEAQALRLGASFERHHAAALRALLGGGDAQKENER